MRYRLSREAEQDVELATETSYDLFGEGQALRYGDLIARAIELAAADPERAGSRARPDLGESIRSLHVGRAARRRAAAAHVIFYTARRVDGEDELVVLHQSMEPLNRIAVAAAGDRLVTRSSRRRPPRSPGR